MEEIINSNKRIAKNTVFLYVRMLLLLSISLYTSRVVLQVLGIDDYGIYNVVSGIIVMFTFVNTALTTGTQRHISYELGKPDKDVAKIFTACLNTHLALVGVIFLFSESIGLWFLNTQMNFPEDRMTAVNWVYQMAILSTLIGVIRTPYESTIVSYERMDFYAYTSIIEGCFRLAMVFALKIVLFDKLILYSCFMAFIVICMFFVYQLYVKKYFEEVRYICINDKGIYKYILSFSAWTLFGAFASLLETQGLNVIINITWGVALNAAVGVATQVRSALYQFVAGFQKALSPQLVMTESNGNNDRQFDLIFTSSRFAFYLMLVLTIPLCANLPIVLDIWLDTVPDYACQICYLMLGVSLLECLSYPLYTTIFATGKIRVYQVVVALIRCFSVTIAFFISKIDCHPFWIYITPCSSEFIILFYRVGFLNKIKDLSLKTYISKVLVPVIIVVILASLPVVIYKLSTDYPLSVMYLLIETICFVGSTIIIVYYVGMGRNERNKIINYILAFIRK